MKPWILAMCALVWTAVPASAADPVPACADLVGSYAEPQTPGRAILIVTLVKNQFGVADADGKKTIVSVTPTERGLVFVEDPKDRNVFRLSHEPGADEYLFERFGHAKDGEPVPDETGHKRKAMRLIRVESSPAKGKATE